MIRKHKGNIDAAPVAPRAPGMFAPIGATLTLALALLRRDWRSGWMVAAQYSFSRARYLNNTEDLRKVPNSPQHLAAIKGAVPILGRTMMAFGASSVSGSKARGARIYAEVIGYGMSGDAFHITAPAADGDGAYRSMKAALKRAGITSKDLDVVELNEAFSSQAIASMRDLDIPLEKVNLDGGALATLSDEEARFMVDAYYAMQKDRIGQGN